MSLVGLLILVLVPGLVAVMVAVMTIGRRG
jgi:hypothetical protein